MDSTAIWMAMVQAHKAKFVPGDLIQNAHNELSVGLIVKLDAYKYHIWWLGDERFHDERLEMCIAMSIDMDYWKLQ